uniref:Uncharacterized protein n=1 Tax=viral metagenome TaxID=1070528 RepID=A0A6M3L082_9ZZZZ
MLVIKKEDILFTVTFRCPDCKRLVVDDDVAISRATYPKLIFICRHCQALIEIDLEELGIS